MKIAELKEALGYYLAADVVPMLVGAPGVGKTEVIKTFAREGGHHMFDLRLGTQGDAGDILGLAEFLKDEKGNTVKVDFMPPTWAYEVKQFAEQNPDKYAIIFLDEINRAHKDILQVVFQLVLEKRNHTMQFPNNVKIIAAQNPPTEDHIVTDFNDAAFVDRFCYIKVAPTVEEWLTYMRNREANPMYLEFFKERPDFLGKVDVEYSLDFIKPTRRTADRLEKLIYKHKLPKHLLLETVIGMLGLEAALALQDHMNKGEKPLTAEEILNNFKDVKPRLEKILAVTDGLRFDLLKHTCDELAQFFNTTRKEEGIKKKEFVNLKEFLMLIPSDLMISFLYQASMGVKFSGQISADTELVDYVRKSLATVKNKKNDSNEN